MSQYVPGNVTFGINGCGCPCHLSVWMGINPPVCKCNCGNISQSNPVPSVTLPFKGYSYTYITDDLSNRIEMLEKHKNHQVDENRQASKRMDELDDNIYRIAKRVHDIECLFSTLMQEIEKYLCKE